MNVDTRRATHLAQVAFKRVQPGKRRRDCGFFWYLGSEEIILGTKMKDLPSFLVGINPSSKKQPIPPESKRDATNNALTRDHPTAILDAYDKSSRVLLNISLSLR